jgi:hypothetical protein
MHQSKILIAEWLARSHQIPGTDHLYTAVPKKTFGRFNRHGLATAVRVFVEFSAAGRRHGRSNWSLHATIRGRLGSTRMLCIRNLNSSQSFYKGVSFRFGYVEVDLYKGFRGRPPFHGTAYRHLTITVPSTV